MAKQEKKPKATDVLIKTKKPSFPVNIPNPSIPVRTQAKKDSTSSNAMGQSGTFLQNVSVRPTRAQTAMHDVKTLHKHLSDPIKNEIKSKKGLKKTPGVLSGTIAAGMVGSAPQLHAAPALANVISGQIGYNKNRRAILGRKWGLEDTKAAANRERSKGLSESDSTLAVQGKLPAASTAGRDTPLPSSDGILKNVANKVLDFIKR